MGQSLPGIVGADPTPPSGDQANQVVSGSFSAVGPGLPVVFWGPFNILVWGEINTALTTTQGSTSFSVASGTGLQAGDAINGVNVPAGTTIATISGTSGTLALPIVSQRGMVTAGSFLVTGLASTAGLLGATVTGVGIPNGTTVSQILVPAAGPTINPTGTGPGNQGTILLSAAATVTSAPPYNMISTPSTQSGTPLQFALGAQAVATGADGNAIFTGSNISWSGSVQVEKSVDGGQTWLLCGVGGQGVPAIYTNPPGANPLSLVVGEVEKGVAYRLNCTALSSGTIFYRMSTSGTAAMVLAPSSVI